MLSIFLKYCPLVLAILVFIIGLYIYFHKETQIAHFSGFAFNPRARVMGAYILGQYKTEGEGFFVGKKISISILLYIRDTIQYNQLKNIVSQADVVCMQNSESPEKSERDIEMAIKNGSSNLDETFIGPGALKMVGFNDEKQTMNFLGDVIFKKEGEIESPFTEPLNSLLESYSLKIKGLTILPAHIKYEIQSNKITLLLTFIAIAIALLSLFIGFFDK